MSDHTRDAAGASSLRQVGRGSPGPAPATEAGVPPGPPPHEVPSQVDQVQDEPQVIGPIKARQGNSDPMTARILIFSAVLLVIGALVAWMAG